MPKDISAKEYMRGFVMRKCVMESHGKRSAFVCVCVESASFILNCAVPRLASAAVAVVSHCVCVCVWHKFE